MVLPALVVTSAEPEVETAALEAEPVGLLRDAKNIGDCLCDGGCRMTLYVATLAPSRAELYPFSFPFGKF